MSFLSLFHNCIPSINNEHHRYDTDTDDNSDEQQKTQLTKGNATVTQPYSSVSAILNYLQLSLKAILPKRIHEPTGPFVLLFDMLLSVFISPGACRATINTLPQFTVYAKGTTTHNPNAVQSADGRPLPTDKCSICLGPYEHMDVVRPLSCNHIFHKECIDAWLLKKSLCPVCKSDPC